MAFDAGDIEARATLDSTPFKQELDATRRDARRFAGERYAAKVDADTTDATAKVISLQERLDRMSRDEITPRVDLKGVTAAEVRVAGLQAQMDRLSRTGGAGGGRGGILSSLAGHAPGFGALAIGAAGPLALPLAGAALGAGAGLLTPLASGLAGIAPFALAAAASIKVVSKDVQTLTKLQQQYNAATTDKQRAAVLVKEHALWKSLDPAQRAAVKNVQTMKAEWAGFQKAVEPQTFGALAAGVGILTTMLRDARPVTKAVGNEIINLEQSAGRAFKDPFWHDFFTNFLAKEAPLAVKTLGTVTGDFFTGLAHLTQDFAPLGHDFESMLVRWSTRFEHWTEGAGPGKFVAWVEKNGPTAAKALEGLAHGVVGIGKGLMPIGQVELKALTPILNFIGKLGDEHPAVITAIGAALLTVGTGLKAIKLAEGAGGILKVLSGGRLGGGGGGGILGGVSKAEPVPVYVTNWGAGGLPGAPGGGKEPVPAGGKGSFFSRFRGVLPAPALLLGTYLAVGRGDQAPGQNGPAYGSPAWKKLHPDAASALLTLKDPTGSGSGDFPSSDYPGGRLNVHSAVGTLLDTGTAAQIKSLHALARAYPEVKAALQDYQGQQNALNKLLLVNPGLTHNVISANALLGPSLDAVAGKAGTAGAALQRKLGAVARIVGAEIGTLATHLQNFLNTPIHAPHVTAAAPTGGGVSRNNQLLLGGGRGSGAAPRVLAGGMTSGAQIATTPLDHYLAGVAATAPGAATATALAGIVARAEQHLINVISTDQNRLNNTLAARQGVVSGVAGGLYGAADIGGAYVNGRVGNIGGYLTNFARSDKRLLRDERQLRHRGLDGRLLEQIANAGPIGSVALAESILSGRSGSIKHLDSLDAAVHRYANRTGQVVGGALYDTRIAAERQDMHRAADTLDEIKHLMHILTDVMRANPHAAGAALAGALDAILTGQQHRHHSRVGP